MKCMVISGQEPPLQINDHYYSQISPKNSQNFYFSFYPFLPYKGFYPPPRNKKTPFSQKKSKKISLTALTPLWQSRNTLI